MRPGRPEDLPSLQELWRAQVRSGHRDAMPHANRFLATFDWAAKSRVIDGDGGRLAGAVLVLERATTDGSVTRVDIADDPNSDGNTARPLARWGIQLSRAAGARIAQVWLGKGHADSLQDLGLELSRPWWRMDRSLVGPLPDPKPPAGYELRDASRVAPGTWAEVHNRGFADHWRFSPPSEDELMAGRPPELSLMAFASDGRDPAAVTLCQVETDPEDMRPQPVGVVMAVSTVQEHRRRGLATWLVAEGMVRLRDAGARHASLYVDGQNHTRASDLYRKLGFEVAFEAEVWEASFP